MVSLVSTRDNQSRGRRAPARADYPSPMAAIGPITTSEARPPSSLHQRCPDPGVINSGRSRAARERQPGRCDQEPQLANSAVRGMPCDCSCSSGVAVLGDGAAHAENPTIGVPSRSTTASCLPRCSAPRAVASILSSRSREHDVRETRCRTSAGQGRPPPRRYRRACGIRHQHWCEPCPLRPTRRRSGPSLRSRSSRTANKTSCYSAPTAPVRHLVGCVS